MATAERTGVRERLSEIDRRLDPKVGKSLAVDELNALFRGGIAPEPRPDGFLSGRLITVSVGAPVDGFVRRVAGMWMPWLGKSFDRSAESGINVLTKSASVPMRGLWPSYEPVRELPDRIEVFPFHTRVGPGAVDSDVDVLKIDYDFEANPDFLIRRILDELVQIGDGVYLGKILYRYRGSFRPIGFFMLEEKLH